MRSTEPIHCQLQSITHLKAALGCLVLPLLVTLAWVGGQPAGAAPARVEPPYGPSKLYLQNLDPANWMHPRVKYYDGATGQFRLETTHAVHPSRGLVINLAAQLGLPTDYAGSAVIESDMPFGLVTTEANGNATTLGKNFKTDGYLGLSTTAPATSVAFPQLLKNIGGAVIYNSALLINNPSAVSTTYATLRLHNWLTGIEHVRSNIAVPPGGSVTTDLATEPALSGVASFYGTGRITGTLPVAMLAYSNGTGAMRIQPGLTSADAATALYFPVLFKYFAAGAFTYSSGVQAMTWDGSLADFTFTYRSIEGTAYVEMRTGVSGANLDLRSSTVLPDNFVGSGVLTANKPIIAIVNTNSNYDSTRGIRTGIYRGMPPARSGARVTLPMVLKYAVDAETGLTRSTGIWFRLAGGNSTTVTLTYYLADGSTAQQSVALTATAPMATFDPRYFSSLPNGTTATGVLTTNPPERIVAVVTVTAEQTLGDVTMDYEGIAQ